MIPDDDVRLLHRLDAAFQCFKYKSRQEIDSDEIRVLAVTRRIDILDRSGSVLRRAAGEGPGMDQVYLTREGRDDSSGGFLLLEDYLDSAGVGTGYGISLSEGPPNPHSSTKHRARVR